MAILKIRDVNGNVQEILAIKGERGDQGKDYVLTEADKQEIADIVTGENDLTSVIKYTEQELTNEQKVQARKNIGAASAEVLDLSGYVPKTDVLSIVSDENFEQYEKPVNTAAVIDYVYSQLGNYLPRNEITRPFAEGEVMAQNIYYQFDPLGESVTIAEQFDKISADIGDIESLLGGI